MCFSYPKIMNILFLHLHLNYLEHCLWLLGLWSTVDEFLCMMWSNVAFQVKRTMVFQVVMYGCERWTIKKAEHLKNWCFWIVVLEKTLESPLDCKEIQPVHPKGNQSWIFIGRTDSEAETPILGHLMQRTDWFEKSLMLGKTEGRRRRGRQRMR